MRLEVRGSEEVAGAGAGVMAEEAAVEVGKMAAVREAEASVEAGMVVAAGEGEATAAAEVGGLEELTVGGVGRARHAERRHGPLRDSERATSLAARPSSSLQPARRI